MKCKMEWGGILCDNECPYFEWLGMCKKCADKEGLTSPISLLDVNMKVIE